jgi:hypothetical protein
MPILLNESGSSSRLLIDGFGNEGLSSSQRQERRLVWIELHVEGGEQCCRRGIIAYQGDEIDQRASAELP